MFVPCARGEADAVRSHPLALGLVLIALLAAGCGGRHASHHSQAAARSRGSARPLARALARRRTLTLRAVPIGRLPAPVMDPATTAYGRGVLLAGGLDAHDVSVDDLVRAGDGPARRIGRLPQRFHDAAAATLHGTPYVFGGGDLGSIAAIRRVRADGRVSAAGRLPSGASDVSAAAVGDTGYVVGGYTGTVPLRSILSYGAGGAVRHVGTLPRALRYAAVASAGGRLIIAGGTAGTSAVADVLRFDPASHRVTRIGRLPAPLTHAAAATLGGTVFVIGGRGAGTASQRAQILAVDPATGRTRRAGHLPAALSDTGVATVNGRILVAGGRDPAGRVHDELLALRPAAAAAAPQLRATSAGLGIPPLLDRRNVYAATLRGLRRAVRADPPRVYVPNSGSNTVDVIDQRTFKVVGHFATGAEPQHVTPSWDLRTLWVDNDKGNSLTPIDPRTGRHGKRVRVLDPYNLYFTPDGRRAIVVAEALKRLDFRDPRTMRLTRSVAARCDGVDHMDMTLDGRRAFVSCEFSGEMIVVDLIAERVLRHLRLRSGAMPQDVKLSPDGRVFYVADMASGGVWVIDAHRFRKLGFIRTGRGAHGLYASRDARVLYVSNRDEGSVAVLSFTTRKVVRKWRLPGSASPDMGGLSTDGRILWLSGRYDAEVYAISTRTGRLLHRIRVGQGPHGLCVWPQPGRYSLGHTGILR
jgi:YVTN family beta-propeller protein